MRSRTAALAILALAAGCSTGGGARSTRLAILPFENLSADPSLDWMGRAFAEELAFQLTGTRAFDPVVVAALRNVPASGAARILQGYYSVQGRRLTVRAVDEHASAAGAVRELTAAAAPGESPVGQAAELARQLDPSARPPATRNTDALRDYVSGLEARDPQATGAYFQQAVTADPDFSSAWLAWIERLASSGRRADALNVLAKARVRASAFPPIEQARLDLTAATLANDRAGQRSALTRLAKLEPADAGPPRTLAELDTAAHNYAGAVGWYQEAAARRPDDPLLANVLGYARLWEGNLDGAVAAFSRYRSLDPNAANPLDSLGDAHYYVGRFDDAAKLYLEAQEKDPAFLGGGELYKAAWARLMAGDSQTAGELFGRYLDARRGDPLDPWRRAQWEYLNGRRRQAIARLESSAAGANPGLAALARAQLAIWYAQQGDREAALAAVAKAPPGNALVEVARLLAQPPASPAEWAARVERAFPAPGQAALRRQTLAFALLDSKQFAAALPVLGDLGRQLPPTSADAVDVLLGWALLETGRVAEAARALRFNPLPDPTHEQPFLSFAFPRIFQLRAELAKKQNRPQEAGKYHALFAKYSS